MVESCWADVDPGARHFCLSGSQAYDYVAPLSVPFSSEAVAQIPRTYVSTYNMRVLS